MIAFRLLGAFGGLTGAAGVALKAYAAHAGGSNLAIAADFLLLHAAPSLLAASGLFGRAGLAGGTLLMVGPLLFGGDLASRDLAGERLFLLAEPAGGVLTLCGWIVMALAAILPRSRN